MVSSIYRRASVALSKLYDLLGALQWNTVGTRLILLNVFVRSCLTFGAPVWATKSLVSHFPGEPRALHSLYVLYHRGLRLMMGAPIDTRLAILHASACMPPLTLPLAKSVWRYFARLDAAYTEEGAQYL